MACPTMPCPTLDDVTAAALLRLFDGQIARFKQPKAVIWLDELPRTALGKVRKHEVKAMLAEHRTPTPDHRRTER